jgi:hypothetical protein
VASVEAAGAYAVANGALAQAGRNELPKRDLFVLRRCDPSDLGLPLSPFGGRAVSESG